MNEDAKCEVCGSVACPSVKGYRCPNALIEVDADSFGLFEKAFAKLVAKARKLGAELPTFEVVTEYSHVFKIGGAHVKAVRVTGPRVKFAGWYLVATLEPFGEGGANLVRSVPGAGELDPSFRVGDQCEHCGTVRRRSETFVVRHDDGRTVRVGRSCLADFLGGDSAASVAARFELLTLCAGFGGEEDTREGGFGATQATAWPLANFLALVIREVKENGWLSRQSARDQGREATADRALDRLTGNPFKKIRAETATEEEVNAARLAIAWAQGLEGRSDFEHNIKAIAVAECVTHSTIGMAAAIHNAHQREIGQEILRRQREANGQQSEHVGTVKARLDLALRVTAVHDVTGIYGTTSIHTMLDAKGNVFKWFASSERLEIGTLYNVRGTVKAHGEYKGRKETVLTRCTAKEVKSLT